MKIQLTIEEAIECFGREFIAQCVRRGLQVENTIQSFKIMKEKFGDDWHSDENREFRRKLAYLPIDIK